MKSILVLNGAARKNGNTAQLLAAFTEGAESAGHSMEAFHLQSMDIHGCLGCNSCKNAPKGSEETCVQKDEMAKIYAAFRRADIIVLVSPYYFWGITGTLKTAVDRLYALTHSTDPKDFRKESALLMTAGATDYSQAVRWYEGFKNYLGWKSHGMVLGSGKTEEARKLGSSL